MYICCLEQIAKSIENGHEEWYDEYVKLFDGSGANDWWD
jgi:hypothetical protein